MININRYSPEKQKLFGSYVIFKSVKDSEVKSLRIYAKTLKFILGSLDTISPLYPELSLKHNGKIVNTN